MRLLHSLAFLGISVAFVEAQDKLTIDTPTNVVQCKTVFITWQGGDAPYSLEIYDSTEPISVIGITMSKSLLWVADVDPSFNPLRIIIQSDDLQTVATNPFNITAAPENCNPESASSVSSFSTSSTSSTSASLPSRTSGVPSPTSLATNSRQHNSPVGIIVGIAIAGVVVLLLLSIGIWKFCRRRSAQNDALSGRGEKRSPTLQTEAQNDLMQAQAFESSPLVAHASPPSTPSPGYSPNVAAHEVIPNVASVPAMTSRSEKGRRVRPDAALTQQPESSSSATDRISQPRQRREEDAGVRVEMPVEDDDPDDSMTLPPAYHDIQHSAGPAVSLDRLVLQAVPSRQP